MSKRISSPKPLFSSPIVNVVLGGFLLAIVIGIASFSLMKPKSLCANSISCIKDLTGNIVSSETTGEFMGKKVSVPYYLTRDLTPQRLPTQVLGDSISNSNKRIFVDLTNQKLLAKEGETTVMEFPISSGKWGRTPTGDFQIWIKLRSTRMQGGSKAKGTYYNLPNVPYTMYFYNNEIPKYRGYGIHGAYWHNNFGHPMSHGCINMRPADAETVYNWATPSSTTHTTFASDTNPGTPITIFGTAAWE